MNRRLRPLCWSLLWVLLVAPAALAGPEEKLKQRLAQVWVEYARQCRISGLKSEAETALARAKAADGGVRDLAQIASEVAMLDGDKEAPPGFDKRRDKARKNAAKIYDKLGKGKEPRHQLWAWEAVLLNPSKARLKKAAAKAQKDLLVIRKAGHPMVGYLSLPRAWRTGREYRILVTVDGAGSNFAGSARRFARTRGNRPFIVLAPCSFSNTNQLTPKKYPFYDPALLQNANRWEFDSAGLLGLLEVVRQHFGGTEKFAITGFSGGGNLAYGMIATQPERLLFAVPACANFSAMGWGDARPVDRGGPRIAILTGEKDPHRAWTHGKVGGVPGIEPQTDNAVDHLKRLGFKNWTRRMLKGVGHSNCAAQVWELADEIVK